ncbi:MAG: hypothetical protein K2L95_02440 [Alphaproteobacteria bacterium]|nr:hypothetical protein [Alphaproteobacteria bacterium]
MAKKLLNFCGLSLMAMAIGVHAPSIAAQAPNARSATTSVTGRDGRTTVTRTPNAPSATTAGTISRAAARRPATTVQRTTATAGSSVSNSSNTSSARSAARRTVVASTRPESTSARAASTTVVRSAASPVSAARSATNAGVSRAASARATAVFDDVSKIGGGYATCRDSYSTCMDQFCAKANETYRRCYCSGKFAEFRDTENALDEAKILLMRFEDNNLNAVDKTAAEVNAMYTATVGEAAIKNDTSAAASVLNEIGDLLSGKKKATASTNNSLSLGILSLDFNADLDDIWSGGADSLFGGTSQDLTQLEGQDLYNAAQAQCLKLVKETCTNDAVLTMAKSSYSILITQDCNAYEKKINSQKEAVSQTVRTAEKYLREARLEEYRAHNSADVNECIAKVKSAITADTACGTNYKKCLDYSGVYIDVNTGDPIYSPRLFELQSQIKLDGSSDVLGGNARFNSFLDTKRMFATAALDTCRDMSDIVWTEFKRAALIEIAQAQDAKIEEVKASCVSTMAECYDNQTGALASFDNTTSQYSGALGARAARAMCADKVAACAALYAGPNDPQCSFDDNGRLTTPNCGLAALVNFVATVDTVRVSEGCATALTNYAKDTCTPSGSNADHGYPWNCRNLTPDALRRDFLNRADLYCKDPTGTSDLNESMIDETVERLITDIELELADILETACEDDAMGLWVDAEDAAGETKELAFYQNVFGTAAPDASAADPNERGYCIQNTVRYQCMAQDEATGGNGYAKFDQANNTCTFTTEWYQKMCEKIGGYWEPDMCYL